MGHYDDFDEEQEIQQNKNKTLIEKFGDEALFQALLNNEVKSIQREIQELIDKRDRLAAEYSKYKSDFPEVITNTPYLLYDYERYYMSRKDQNKLHKLRVGGK